MPTRSKETKDKSRVKTLICVLKKRDVIHGMTPKKLRLILEDMGPTYIKLGQIMSMRSDILPQEYCDELQNLRARVSPVPFYEIKKVMEDEWGKSVSQIFESIDKTPLGSASIAQVYRAVLKNTQENVVVKVQRPNIFEIMAKDVKLIHKALKALRIVGIKSDAFDFDAVIEEMWTVARQEMNFILEAEHLERFSKFNNQIAYVKVPVVHHNLTTSKVLVMEQIGGVPIDCANKLKQRGYDINDIGRKLAENYSKQVLDDAFFHADPHPGNIRIEDGKIVFIDLGMTGSLSERDRTLIKAAIVSLSSQNIHRLKEILLTLGKPLDKVNHSTLYGDLENLVRKYLSLEIGQIELAKLVGELLELASLHKIRMPSTITMLARGIMTIEGVLSKLCPDVNLLQIITAHLASEKFENFDIKSELRGFAINGYNSLKRGLELPVSMADIAKMAIKGQLKANLEIVGSDEPLKKVDAMVTRLIVCIFAAALLMGSSIICTTQMQPRFFGIPLIGAAGFFVAVILGGWLTIDTVFDKRRRKK